MTEIVKAQGSTLTEKMSYAQALAGASLLPKHYQKQPANLLFALEYADALGVTPIHAITSIYVVDGKPTASADLISALVRKAGHKLRISGDDTRAVAELVRADDPDHTFRVEWTLERARVAGLLGKGVWKSYPAAMLRSRAITEVARAGASDALFGVIYTPEELGANVDDEGSPTDLGEVAPPAPSGATRKVQRKPAAKAPAPALPPVVHDAPAGTEAEQDPEVVDAEPVEEVPDLATAAQIDALVTELQRAGFTTKAQKSDAIAEQLGVRKNATELTAEEAVNLAMFFADYADAETADAQATPA